MNRLVRKTPDSSLGEAVVTYSYTPAGDRATMTDASGTTTYGYDSRHRLVNKTTPQGALTYTYDATGNLASTRSSNAGGVSIDYTYDAANRLESVVDTRLANGTTTYTYDGVHNVLSTTAANGVKSVYTYNSVDRMLQLTDSKEGGTLASYTHTLDPTGRRLSVTENTGRVTAYTYDSLYRLKSETVSGDPASSDGSVNYTYDAVDNRLSRSSTLAAVPSTTSAYDANDRLISDSYDANGNTRSANGISYAYDFENRIKTANGGAVKIVYDGDGNRVSETIGGTTTKFLVDDVNPTGYSQVMDEVVDGSVTRTYAYGLNRISEDQLVNGSWVSSFYGYDGHGNVRFLASNGGAVTDTYTFDAFGAQIGSTGTTSNQYLYSGERFDQNLGLYHLRARDYNPLAGRFGTMDSQQGDIMYPATLHKYLYAQADPVNRIDPSGLADLWEYSFMIRNTVYKIAIHSAHHYWTLPIIGKLWCIHIALYIILRGVGLQWSQQIPLPWCSGKGPF
jgi:RHS repeat-associated protein